MNKFMSALVVLAASTALVPVAVQAADAAAAAVARPGDTLYTADGHRIGQIDEVRTNASGPVATIIVASHFVYVPTSTISQSGKHLTTSMTLSELSAH